MTKNQIITIDNFDGSTTEHVVIDRGNGEFTSMPKSVYDEQQAISNSSTTWVEPQLTK